ncbi:glycosyltransferase 61 family protein [Cyanobium sp. CH-040]|uniref:glycosyltransferase 61 family protein n=1 Tax=Cyanobium sp. CH-040 TaxID=2823708 RepID=UPI0020CCEAE2|nr:glycosyltransferase 61 family protein [Cyanobium sp. CH-040]MCP9928015.1 DUF563 domain-containing protein [Cyanobium sp. CH-040]
MVEPQAMLLPTRRTGSDGKDWWKSRSQGGLNRQGEPIGALTDWRGTRCIYALHSRTGGETPPAVVTPGAPLLYGGTLYHHFGHLLLDLSRTYQLLRLFRRSKEPIWFHYQGGLQGGLNAAPRSDSGTGGASPHSIEQINNPLILEWLECLGLRKRARLIRKKLPAAMLVSSSPLFCDRRFVSADFPLAAQAALAPRLRRRLERIEPVAGRIAYLSRHKLQGGTTRFVGEDEVVAAIADHPRIDVICPEELSIKEKLALYRRYPLITGFAQACMNLKFFAPYTQVSEVARQVMFIAGPRSLSSNWVNLDRAAGFGDRLLDCSLPEGDSELQTMAAEAGFQRSSSFDVQLVVRTLLELAG